jgi:small acid-soluble spore protein D (minor alpha/beta-type SASP)
MNAREVNIMSRPKTPLVPGARDALTKFKLECAQEIGHMDFVKENNDHYKGDVSSKQNGLEGGPIGGQMVKRMIQMAESQLK